MIEHVKGTFDLLPGGKEEWHVVRGVEAASGQRWVKVVRGWAAKEEKGEEDDDYGNDDDAEEEEGEEDDKEVKGLEDWVRRHKGVVEGDQYGEQVLSFMSEPSYEKRGWSREVARTVLETSRRRQQQAEEEDE